MILSNQKKITPNCFLTKALYIYHVPQPHKMKIHFAPHGLFMAMLLLVAACKKTPVEIERGFYYWKSDPYSLDIKEENYLNENKIQKLYVKMFEIDTDSVLGAIPVSKSSLHIWYNGTRSTDLTSWNNDSKYNFTAIAKTMDDLEIVPTIFIKNKVLSTASKGSLDSLTDNISFLINKRYQEHFSHRKCYTEIQLDCDWTEKTRDNYFYLLKKLKAISGKSISCTLRLYPYKYRSKMGIPPVDKAVLMCYNLLNPLTNEDKNSILSANELKKYLAGRAKYPVHLDFALPVFSWMQVYQNNQFQGIIYPRPNEIKSNLKPLKKLWYEVTTDWETGDLYLRAGDKVKLEDVSAATIKETINLLKKYAITGKKHSVIFFHLDQNNLTRFDNETINSFYTDFGN